MTYRQTITIKKELLDRIKCLLKIDDLQEELTEQELSLNPMEYDKIELADNVTFENGKSINISISSGDRYYYDDCYFLLMCKQGNKACDRGTGSFPECSGNGSRDA